MALKRPEVSVGLSPYLAAFAARFQVMLQYRAAALAGFATQCWWGAIKIMIYAAFFGAVTHGHTPITLPQAITYTWLAQAFFILTPWAGDPEVAAKVRSGAVGYDRVRPLDAYGWWYANTAAWLTARAIPRAGLMFALTGLTFPLVGLGAWSWRPPASAEAGALFAISILLVVLLSTSIVMLINLCVAQTLTDRGVNSLMPPLVIVLSGNLLPLPLFPDWARTALFLQPFAGVVDIPVRIYFGGLAGPLAWAGLGLQAFWTLGLIALGRAWMGSVMGRLQVQGG
jgi:ABC-2 type transport system permease protein